jgi:hypothetical protein
MRARLDLVGLASDASSFALPPDAD